MGCFEFRLFGWAYLYKLDLGFIQICLDVFGLDDVGCVELDRVG